MPDAPANLRNNQIITDAGVIGILWDEGVANGATPVIDYRLQYRLDSSSTWLTLASFYKSTSYTLTGIANDSNYRFRVQSRNKVGFSAYSSEVVVKAARLPETPTNVVTSIGSKTVIITWTAPNNGGSPITQYYVAIRESDGATFTQDLVNCPGTTTATLTTQTCTIPFSALKAAPYSIEWATLVYAKVRAVTLVGTSPFTAVSNGIEITNEPDAP